MQTRLVRVTAFQFGTSTSSRRAAAELVAELRGLHRSEAFGQRTLAGERLERQAGGMTGKFCGMVRGTDHWKAW